MLGVKVHRIEAPHFVAGIVTNEQGIVIRSAPIVRWTVGLSLDEVRSRLKRGYTIEEVLEYGHTEEAHGRKGQGHQKDRGAAQHESATDHEGRQEVHT